MSNRRFLSVREFCDKYGFKVGSFYHKTRINAVPGIHRSGRLIVIDTETFERESAAESQKTLV